MADKAVRRPVLYRGEVYSSPVQKGTGGSTKEPSLSYEEARSNVLSNILSTREYLDNLPNQSKLPHEFVVCVRLDPDFSAKSYYPESLFNYSVPEYQFEEIGSRLWRSEKTKTETPSIGGKMLFARTTKEGLSSFEKKLNRKEADLKKSFIYDIRKIHKIDILDNHEQALGFTKKWKQGIVEAVLHPFLIDNSVLMEHFLKLLKSKDVPERTIRSKQYDRGITFVSFEGNQAVIRSLANYNPLRTIHPLDFGEVNEMRGSQTSGAPRPPQFNQKSPIIVGMFDGGIEPNNPLLKGYSENVELATKPATVQSLEHGSAVAGAILYGPLNSYGKRDVLPEPAVSVRSFRVLPSADKNPDLYEIIDTIEAIIPPQKDIQVYNLSLGPKGFFTDDPITRFTYACDRLAAKYNVLFCSAVGNNGEEDPPYNRIQSPADMVNGIAVASFTKRNGGLIRAPYSNIGPGREGNKLKPDVAAFGGCDQSPIHLISNINGNKLLWWGTSFATPIVSGVAAQLIGRSNNVVDPLTARALIIHGAALRTKDHSLELGHGFLSEEIEQIISCDSNSYTLIYRGEITPNTYVEYLVPWVNGAQITQAVDFCWTLATISEVDPQSPDEYTTSSLEVSFYPNSNKYRFYSPDKKNTQTIDIKQNPQIAEDLEKKGWKRNTFPISEIKPREFATEDLLREDMKWDTVEHRKKSKKTGKDIDNPKLHIHAFARGNRSSTKKIGFALVLTVSSPKSTIDIYPNVLKNFTELSPIRLSAVNEIRVRT